jgi:pilus assembly protein Flp/PilA
MFTKLYVRARNWMAQDDGATAVEYGIMVAAIAAVIVALVFLLGGQVKAAFQTVYNELIKTHYRHRPGAGGRTTGPRCRRARRERGRWLRWGL